MTARLDGHPDWEVIQTAWRFCAPAGGAVESTAAWRTQADRQLDAARQAARRLAAAGVLSEAEAALLAAEIDSVSAAIHARPPAEIASTCYKVAMVPAARQSVERLAVRLPLLEKLVAGGRVSPDVAGKLLAGMVQEVPNAGISVAPPAAPFGAALTAVGQDLAVLSDRRQFKLAEFTAAEAAQARRVRSAAKAAIRKLQKLLEAGK